MMAAASYPASAIPVMPKRMNWDRARQSKLPSRRRSDDNEWWSKDSAAKWLDKVRSATAAAEPSPCQGRRASLSPMWTCDGGAMAHHHRSEQGACASGAAR